MSELLLIEIMQKTLYVVALLSAPPLITMIVVGLASQVLQTVTQLKDQSLSFIPKVVISVVIMLILLPWYLKIIRQYFEQIFEYMGRGPL